jgi:hypothetical protein
VTGCLVVSWLSRDPDERTHRMGFHNLYAVTVAISASKRFLRPVAWALTLIWFFFAVGPGAILGNAVFGPPNAGLAGWVMGVPSLWGWQMLWWALGVLLIWLLAYRLEMATLPRGDKLEQIDPAPVPIAAGAYGAGTARQVTLPWSASVPTRAASFHSMSISKELL